MDILSKVKSIDEIRLDTDADLFNVLCGIDKGERFSHEVLEEIRKWEIIRWDDSILEKTKWELPKCMGLLESIDCLELSFTNVNDISPLSTLTTLTHLSLGATRVNDIDALRELSALRKLYLWKTNVSDIHALSGLTSLVDLDLSDTKVTDIDALKDLNKISRLYLRGLNLSELPEFMVDYKIPFIDTESYFEKGINIHGLSLANQDISIFLSNNPILIREYCRHQQKDDSMTPLNEVKVVFLGDGGAGKTLAIERLFHDGAKVESFNGESTPGICIKSKTYTIGEDDIEVHFWDFGGQEILHSMHRMFLTQRTLYIVFLNARDNKQDGQAWYWLNNIRSFAKDAPVLIILNQMDQNPTAALNETGLKNFYPTLEKNILKISALNDSQEIFNKKVTQTIKHSIDKMTSVRASFPIQWKRLMYDIQCMEDNYIQADTFRKKCTEKGIVIEKDSFDSIISLFQDIGVCFCSQKNAFQSNYMVLKPEWMTNALYILAFNGQKYAKNGILTETDCFELFKRKVEGEEATKMVREDIGYNPIEIRYILDVVLNFGLLYRIDRERFFMPMLCDPDERDVVKRFLDCGGHLHTSYVYEYLPSNVIHRLMVHFGKDLNMNQVWRNGALFEREECGWQALAFIRQNNLEIYVKGKMEEMYPGASYWRTISRAVAEINAEFGLKADEWVYHDWQGKEEAFDLEFVEGTLAAGSDLIYSKYLRRLVAIKEILAAYELSPEAEEQEVLRKNICKALLTLQGNHDYLRENNYNARVRDLIRMVKKYVCKDETREGVSVNKNDSGELDILIWDRILDKDLAIYEGLRLQSFGDVGKTYLDNHLNKLLDNYNSKGIRYLYLVSYVDWRKDRFATVADEYYRYITRDSKPRYPLTSIKSLEVGTGQFIRCWEAYYNCGSTPLTVFHFIVRMGD